MPSFFFLDCCRLGHSSGNGVQTLIPVTLLTRLSCVRVSGFLCHTQDIREDKTHCHPQTLFARDKKKEGTSYKTKSRFFNTKRTWNLWTSSMSETMKFRFLFPCFLYLFEAKKHVSLYTHKHFFPMFLCTETGDPFPYPDLFSLISLAKQLSCIMRWCAWMCVSFQVNKVRVNLKLQLKKYKGIQEETLDSSLVSSEQTSKETLFFGSVHKTHDLSKVVRDQVNSSL